MTDPQFHSIREYARARKLVGKRVGLRTHEDTWPYRVYYPQTGVVLEMYVDTHDGGPRFEVGWDNAGRGDGYLTRDLDVLS